MVPLNVRTNVANAYDYGLRHKMNLVKSLCKTSRKRKSMDSRRY